MSAPSGLVIVDKPGGMTSHDVVARIRRMAGTRRVGHAGTLDPMATGVLVIGVERATRLLGYLALTEKQYAATIRLGQSTSTDDAEGEVTVTGSAAGVCPAALTDAGLAEAMASLTGEIQQVPPAISAIKVAGQRAYRLTRAGTAPELAARSVRVHEFAVTAVDHVGDMLDVDATVRCSSGTYIRALARDLGAALGTGGHLTRLRRTRVGGYGIDSARTLDELAELFEVVPLAQAASVFPRRDLSADEARRLAHGGRLAAATAVGPVGAAALASSAASAGTASAGTAADTAASLGLSAPEGAAGPTAAYAPDGALIALVTEESGQARPLVVFA